MQISFPPDIWATGISAPENRILARRQNADTGNSSLFSAFVFHGMDLFLCTA